MRTVKKVDLNIPEGKRIIAISDIHGHCDYLKGLLSKINFSSEDILFIVGDILEKGPDSLKTLRYVMELCKTNTVYPLIGNVDAWQVLLINDDSESCAEEIINHIKMMDKYWGGCFFLDMCKELGINIASISDVFYAKKLIRKHFKAEINFLKSFPTLIETQKLIFVHGGLPDSDLTDITKYDVFELLKNDAYMEKGICLDKYTVVGHWPVSLYCDNIPQLNPIINERQKIISIDGGCGLKDAAQLNALIINDIDSLDFTYEYYDALKTGYAKTSQKESIESVYIKWSRDRNNNKFTVIKKGDEFSIVKHDISGRSFDMANDFISDLDGDAYCSDYTNYCLNVEEGDRLSIVKETSRGYYVKKNGIIGWYLGEIVLD